MRTRCQRYQVGLVSSPDFTFEELSFEDLPFLIEVRNECREFLHDDRVFTLTECERWFRETKPDFRVIRYRGERIGYFRVSNYNPDDASIYIGADLHKTFAAAVWRAKLMKGSFRFSDNATRFPRSNGGFRFYPPPKGLYQTPGFSEPHRKKLQEEKGREVKRILRTKLLPGELMGPDKSCLPRPSPPPSKRGTKAGKTNFNYSG